jgi:hybrid cluster-associated redox disulfide protein
MDKRKSPQIHRQMPIQEIVTMIPEAKSVLAEYGLHCFSCAGSEFENLDDGCKGHGFSDEEITELVDDLNVMFDEMPSRPEILTLTADAARAIQKVARDEGEKECGLEVIADATGGFCMEFRSGAAGKPDEKTFENDEVPGVRLFASALTLKRIGGAKIDFREGRFKLDLPEDAQKIACGCTPETCDCAHKTAQTEK